MPDFGRWTSNGGDPSLNEINRMDRFIDALASEQPVYSTDPGEAELAQLLAGWRDEVRGAPLKATVTTNDAAVALDRATHSRRRGHLSMAVVGSLAAAVLCLGGFGAVVAGAGPGDALYGLRTLIFGEQHATRDDPVMLASQQLAEVQQLIDQGQWDAAQDKLQTLTTTVATVNDVEQKQELVTQWQELTVKVESKDANATPPPGAPLPTFPDVPVPVDPGSATSTTSTETTTSSETSTPSSSETTTPSSSETTTPSSETTTPSSSETTTTSPPTSTTTTSPPTSTTTTTTNGPAQELAPAVSTAPATPLPTPSALAPLPTPSALTPLPTPSALAPLPTPSALTPLPTPSALAPLPTPAAQTPLPTPTGRPLPTPTPLPTPSVVEQQEPATTVPPVIQAPAPRVVVTTTVVVPAAPDGPR